MPKVVVDVFGNPGPIAFDRVLLFQDSQCAPVFPRGRSANPGGHPTHNPGAGQRQKPPRLVKVGQDF